MAKREELLTAREAARVLGISYTTVKQWIYKKKLRTVITAGGHHRVPEREIDRYLHHRILRADVSERRLNFRKISGRNQLIGRVIDIRISGLIAQVILSLGDQHVSSIITAEAVRGMRLKVGETAAALIKSTEVMVMRL